MHAQVLFVQECMGYRIRDCADSKLDGGTVLHQFGHVTANLFFHFPERKRIHGFKWVVILVNAVSLADMYLIVAVNHRKAWHNLQKYLFCRIAEIRFIDIGKGSPKVSGPLIHGTDSRHIYVKASPGLNHFHTLAVIMGGHIVHPAFLNVSALVLAEHEA